MTGSISSILSGWGRTCRLPPETEMTHSLHCCPRVESSLCFVSRIRWDSTPKGWTVESTIPRLAGREKDSGRPTAREHLFTPKVAREQLARSCISSFAPTLSRTSRTFTAPWNCRKTTGGSTGRVSRQFPAATKMAIRTRLMFMGVVQEKNRVQVAFLRWSPCDPQAQHHSNCARLRPHDEHADSRRNLSSVRNDFLSNGFNELRRVTFKARANFTTLELCKVLIS